MLGNVAIDIGSHAVKLLVINKKSKGCVLQYYAEEPLNMSSSTKREDAVKHALKSVFSGYKMKHSVVFTGVSYGDTIVREVTFDEIGGHDLEGDIANALSDMLPFPIEQVYFDFTQEDDNKFLTAACRTELIDSKISMLQESMGKNKSEISIDIDAYAYGRLLSQLYLSDFENGDALLLADMGKTNTKFYIYDKNGLSFSRIQQIGGDYVTEMLVDHLGVDFAKAEQFKLDGGFSSELIEEIMSPFAQHFAEQVTLVNDFYEASKKTDTKIGKVILCGGGACLDSFVKYMKKYTDYSVDLLNFSELLRSSAIGEKELLEIMLKYALDFALLCEGVEK